MWPYLWGHIFWNMLHSVAYYAKRSNTPWTDEERARVLRFLQRLCPYLPCPACSLHCSMHLATHPPIFNSGEEFWKYTVDMHNEVNGRNQKLQFSYEEAEAALGESYAKLGLDLTTMDQTIPRDWWLAICLSAYKYATFMETATDEQQSTYREFLTDLFALTPFASSHPDQMASLFALIQTVDLTHTLVAMDSIVKIHNHVALDVGVPPMTLDEMKVKLFGVAPNEPPTHLTRAAQMREEDHKKMLQFQQELVQQQRNQHSSETVNQADNPYFIATIALSCLLGLLILMVVAGFMVYRFREKGKSIEPFDNIVSRRHQKEAMLRFK
jgi:hypothetical protein